MFRLGCGVILILLIGIPIVCQRFLPWWGTLVVIAGEILLLIVGGPKLFGYLFKRMAISLFMTKSAVLRGAMVSIERVEPTTSPATEEASLLESDSDDEDEDVDTSRKDLRYYLVEFHITPKPGQSRMQHYEPGEMQLVPFDMKVGVDEDEKQAAARSASMETIHLINENGDAEEIDKIVGPARLRAVVGCPPTLRGRAKFRYYFESFGDVMLA